MAAEELWWTRFRAQRLNQLRIIQPSGFISYVRIFVDFKGAKVNRFFATKSEQIDLTKKIEFEKYK